MSQVRMDIDVKSWSFEEQRAYRSVAGDNPRYVIVKISRIYDSAMAGTDGAADELLNINPDWLIGFAWMAERRRNPAVSFDAVAASVNYDELVDSFSDLMTDMVEAEMSRGSSPLEPGTATSSPESSSPTVPSGQAGESASPSLSSSPEGSPSQTSSA